MKTSTAIRSLGRKTNKPMLQAISEIWMPTIAQIVAAGKAIATVLAAVAAIVIGFTILMGLSYYHPIIIQTIVLVALAGMLGFVGFIIMTGWALPKIRETRLRAQEIRSQEF